MALPAGLRGGAPVGRVSQSGPQGTLSTWRVLREVGCSAQEQGPVGRCPCNHTVWVRCVPCPAGPTPTPWDGGECARGRLAGPHQQALSTKVWAPCFPLLLLAPVPGMGGAQLCPSAAGHSPRDPPPALRSQDLRSRQDVGAKLLGAALAQLDTRTSWSGQTRLLADPHLGLLRLRLEPLLLGESSLTSLGT